MLDRIHTVRVAAITPQTAEVSAFELVNAHGPHLPGYAAGAHIDVHLPGGFMRPYSLACASDGAERTARYLIGVKREPNSRGGSAALHGRVKVGDLLAVSSPRNTFPLRAGARRHLLLAGGIGLTPLLAMAQALARDGHAFELCVFVRSRAHLAFAHELADPALAPHVRLHVDDGQDKARIDLPTLLADATPGTHVYLCGPAGFMQAVRQGWAHWPDEQLHLEYFAPPEGSAEGMASEPFTLELMERGLRLAVSADQSAVQALHELGIDVTTSCEQGVCGTCVVAWEGATPDHRDYCLSATERRHKVALCCSRAQGAGGVLRVRL